MKNFDLAIIGAGPIGLFAAHYAHLHGLKTIILESLSKVGGQPEFLYPNKKITDIPAYTSISGQNLIQNLKQNLSCQAQIEIHHRVRDIKKTDSHFVIDNQYRVKSVLLATGNGSFKPRKLPFKINNKLIPKIHYSVLQPKSFQGETVGIFGGGDSALDFALELAPYAKIKLIHRRSHFRGLETNVQQLKKLQNVEILTPFLPTKIVLSKSNKIDVTLKKVGQMTARVERLDQIFVAYGFLADNRLPRKWGLRTQEGRIKVERDMMTNINGIFAIGDTVTYPDRVPLIGLGFGEAQIAITAIMRQLFPEKKLTIHSTSL